MATARRELAQWYELHQRNLPWRKTQDPYAIWICEVMSQQTQVATVIPYYERFLEAFPTVHALASAPVEHVLTLWSGLGYYSRARNLHRGAQYLVDNHGGAFPAQTEDLLKVPGIGPYTAGAIVSISFNLAAPVVDGNVQRVFSRLFEVTHSIETAQARHFFWATAQKWAKGDVPPRIANQSLMELGATLCRKHQPLCTQCPIQAHCQAFKKQAVHRFPVVRPRAKMQKLYWATLIVEKQERVWMTRNAPGDWWADLWDFPRVHATSVKTAQQKVRTQWPHAVALDHVTHTVTHHAIHVAPFVLTSIEEDLIGPGQWVSVHKMHELPLSALAKKVMRHYEHHRSSH